MKLLSKNFEYTYKNILWIDLETFSELKLSKIGSYRYAEDCEILLWAWAFNDDSVHVWDVTVDPEPPVDLLLALFEADTIGWHNGNNFDRMVIKNSRYAKLIEGKKYFDTMVQAYQHALPGGLALLCTIFDLSEDVAKAKEGKSLVRLFSQPLPKNQKGYRATRYTHPEEWQKFIDYAHNDILAMRTIHKLIPKWNLTENEYNLQQLDQRINDRGFAIDTDLCEKVVKMLSEEKQERDERTSELTLGEVSAATQRDKLLQYLCEIWGAYLPDMQKSTLERCLLDENLPDTVKELIVLRLDSAANNTKKYSKFLDIACADGRVRGTLQFRGAFRTGRHAARLVQPQNMVRPSLPWEEIEFGIDSIKGGYYDLCYR